MELVVLIEKRSKLMYLTKYTKTGNSPSPKYFNANCAS